MGYCELADLQKYMDQQSVVDLADDDGDGVSDDGVIDEVIAAASAEIDGYISSQYSTPLTTVPAIVRRIAAKLSINELYLRRTEVRIPDKWDKEIDDVRKMLGKISTGTLQLGTSAPQATGDLCEAGRAETESTFNDTSLAGF